ncbi:MAG: DUF2924 domain-containing protein [Planctomycetes bacterium]|nr:DUF2924 domain-containing protein [Planctomycetota bacterium]MCB9901561.1 DUF2924 domain-containing protein [Planctomycetota bacterium]
MAAKTKGKGRKKAAKKPARAAPKARTTKPKAAKPAPANEAPARERDPRLPKPGDLITRTFQDKEIRVQVLDAGFLYDGKTWRSLSAIAKEVTGTSWNGFLFFGLQSRAKTTGGAE